jgi:HSP20 family molecular chaperone IbpA
MDKPVISQQSGVAPSLHTDGEAPDARRRRTMRALAPWTGMTSLRREMDRLFDRFFDTEPGWEALEFGGEWAPKVDLSEAKEAYVLRAEIPGVEQKDIQISLQDQLLTIKGEKSKEKEEKDEHYHRKSAPTAPSRVRCGCPPPSTPAR